MYDTEKNERKRSELVRSYFLDDPNQVVPVLMERNKKYWEYEWIFQWNTGIMDDDGNVLLRFKGGAKGILHCSQINYRKMLPLRLHSSIIIFGNCESHYKTNASPRGYELVCVC